MFEFDAKDRKVLFGCIAGSFLAYHTTLQTYRYFTKRSEEWIPVGFVKSLHVYPIKSCAPTDMFSFKCTAMGLVRDEMEDRNFLVVDGTTGKFYTARQKPKLINVKASIDSRVLTVEMPGKPNLSVNLDDVVQEGKLLRATLFENLKQDGYDCGDEMGQLFSDYIEEPNTRLIYYTKGLYTERTCVPDEAWWNNPVPKRKDDSGFTDLAPYLITTEASVQALNEKLEDKVTFRNFRPSIHIEGCQAWDEDRWAEVRIGDAQLECFSPCTRCVLTTVDPDKGVMNRTNQPLKKMREFRLAPEGKMRQAHKDSPVFGVYAGMKNEAYIHIGQPVYVRYKPSVF